VELSSHPRLILQAARTILPFMAKEFEFFITEDLPQVIAWARQREQQGAVVVGNAEQLLGYLKKHTKPSDDFSCRISGAWLDECIKWSVRWLLTPATLEDTLPKRSLSSISVDLTTCVAFSERNTEISIEERRCILETALYYAAHDPRLTILPARQAR